ncbi:MAG: hypothetical protein GX608_03515 [Lentisphaerae bacterium]|nr:hypothetical protein [Lentisphaerota bacterium]
MATHYFQIVPRDLLFLRDARPMSASDAGHGAHWPRPDQLWTALLHAFHRRWPERQAWECAPRGQEAAGHSGRFGALKTAGPFPLKDGKLFLPCPLDLSPDGGGALHPMRVLPAGCTDLPAPLRYAFSSATLGKARLPEWISAEDYAAYLQHQPFTPAAHDLYDLERTIGIAINADTHAAAEGQLYQGEYLRLRETTRLAIAASCTITGPGKQPVDVLGKLTESNDAFPLGGQQGMVRLEPGPALPLPASRQSGRFVKWALLSPAVFPATPADPARGIAAYPGGWLPNWIEAETGQVMLPQPDLDLQRQPGERREAWRRRVARRPRCSGRLAAARIGKPLAFSGWDVQDGAPKPTFLAVPAGSVYLFECPEPADAAALAAALSWNGGSGSELGNRRSTLFGEKGFGLGVCSGLQQPVEKINR